MTVELVFDPQTGTTTCAPASDAKIVFTSSAENYQSNQNTGDPLYANGKFHVLRKK